MKQVGVGVLFVLLTIIWTGVLWWVATRANESIAYERMSAVVSRVRRLGTVLLLLVLGAAFVVSLSFLPYASARERRLGPPELVVDVTGSMWAWQLSQEKLPSGKVIEFRVTAKDVNHGFAIYASDGRIVGQTQAMPGYTNALLVRFDQPGEYLIRCLEFCGTGHHLMIKPLIVE